MFEFMSLYACMYLSMFFCLFDCVYTCWYLQLILYLILHAIKLTIIDFVLTWYFYWVDSAKKGLLPIEQIISVAAEVTPMSAKQVSTLLRWFVWLFGCWFLMISAISSNCRLLLPANIWVLLNILYFIHFVYMFDLFILGLPL